MNTGAPTTLRIEWPWIISPRQDLVWLIGGALAAWALAWLVFVMGANLLLVWFVWVTFVDTPHFFGTYTRTVLDPEERGRWHRVLIASCGLLLAGPAVVGLCAALYGLGVPAYALPWKLFLGWFFFEAYWHVVRQHYGIYALYSRKQNRRGEIAARPANLERWALSTALLAPGVAFLVRNPELRSAFGLKWSSAPVVMAAAVVTAIAVVVLLVREGRRMKSGDACNGAKLLLLVAIVPVYAWAGFHPASVGAPLLAFSMFVTVHHDLQYDAIVWFWHRNRRQATGVAGAGLAGGLTRNLAVFLLGGIVMAVVFRLLGCTLEITPGCLPVVRTSAMPLCGEISMRELLTGLFLGFPLQHYYIDRHIWRPGADKMLVRDLRLT